MDTNDIVNAIMQGDQNQFQSAFNAVMAAKVSDALDVKKVEVASNLVTPEEDFNEDDGTEAEVNGVDELDWGNNPDE